MKGIYSMTDYSNHKIVNRNGYQAIYLPDHPLAYADGMVYLHIFVAENILQRNLLPEECVHHIDFNRQNNTPSNLMVFKTNNDHIRYHAMLNNCVDYVLIRISNVYQCVAYSKLCAEGIDLINLNSNLLSKKICPNCGKWISIKAKYCRSCYYQNMTHMPNKQILIDCLHQYKNFVRVGKYFGVTDNCVRKWCKKYNIPSTSKAIRTLSDSEWKLL